MHILIIYLFLIWNMKSYAYAGVQVAPSLVAGAFRAAEVNFANLIFFERVAHFL